MYSRKIISFVHLILITSKYVVLFLSLGIFGIAIVIYPHKRVLTLFLMSAIIDAKFWLEPSFILLMIDITELLLWQTDSKKTFHL